MYFKEKLASKEEEIIASMSVLDEPIDLTVPGKKVNAGALHPITQMRNDLNEAFLSLGFEVYTEDDISSEEYAFDNLNLLRIIQLVNLWIHIGLKELKIKRVHKDFV